MTAKSIEDRLSDLSVSEKVSLLAGATLWRTVAVERAGIPAIKVSDGPNAVRGEARTNQTSACFPVGSALAASWNVDLIEAVGKALGAEAKTKGAQVVLGPTINLQRTPIGGRNFECYSEDPYLTGRMATAFVNGLQSQGVGACPKHFVGNDTEVDRHALSSDIDAQPLHELYLRPFEMVVREAAPWTIMSSYNRVNGTYAASSRDLLVGLLKEEWGWDGLVMSDWGGATETLGNALGGLDLEMPGPARTFGERLLALVESGQVPMAVIDDKVHRLLRLLEKAGAFDGRLDLSERSQDLPEHRALARQAASEGMVLLKNDGVLPLRPTKSLKVAVIGPNAAAGQIQGGGSSAVMPHYQVAPLDAITSALGGDCTVVFEPGCDTAKYCPAIPPTWLRPDGLDGETGLAVDLHGEGGLAAPPYKRSVRKGNRLFFGGLDAASSSVRNAARLKGWLRVPVGGRYTFGLMSAGLARLFIDGKELIDNWTSQEPGESFFAFGSKEKRAEIKLRPNEDIALEIVFEAGAGGLASGVQFGLLPPMAEDMLTRAVAAAASADRVIVCVGTNSDWETEGNDRSGLALPGAQDDLIDKVLDVHPDAVIVVNSSAPISMPWAKKAKAILWTWFPGQEFGNALADCLFGHADPGGRLPLTFPEKLEDTPAFSGYPGTQGRMRYGEGLFVGYRWYQKRNIPVLFALGHGLSYGRYALADLSVTRRDEAGVPGEATCIVENTGARPGHCVVQLYVRPDPIKPGLPVRELKGFAKVLIVPGERKQVRVPLDTCAFSHWNTETGAWTVYPGDYVLEAGFSADDLAAQVTVSIGSGQ